MIGKGEVSRFYDVITLNLQGLLLKVSNNDDSMTCQLLEIRRKSTEALGYQIFNDKF